MAFLATVVALPGLLFLYVCWVVAMLLRPFVLVASGCALWNAPAVLLKAKLTAQGGLYMFFCKDKKWKKPVDPASHPIWKDKSKVTRKTVIFVRHGESCWNDTFNAGERSKMTFIKGFIPGMIKALCYETYLLLSGQVDSWFYDSPLSHYGLAQIDKLAKFLGKPAATPAEKEILAILRGETNQDGKGKSSVMVSSNLRRALSTIVIGFRERLATYPNEKIVITPSLQEISQNIDTLSITPPHTAVTASWIERETLPQMQPIFNNRVDMSLHTGNKPLNTNGLKRMSAFCEFAFSRQEQALICGGHSLWFRFFFQTFLPYSYSGPAKAKKMVNGGCVAFDLMKAEVSKGQYVYMIDETTIQVVYGGF